VVLRNEPLIDWVLLNEKAARKEQPSSFEGWPARE
jgi:hypothetical protein